MSNMKEPKTFDLLGKRRIFGGISALLVLAAIALMIVPGPNYGIDFSGGTNIIASFETDIPEDELRTAAQELGLPDAQVQQFGGDAHEYLITTQEVSTVSEEQSATVESMMVERFGEGTSVRIDDSSGDRFYVRLPLSAFGVESEDGIVDAEAVLQLAEQADARAEDVAATATEAGLGGVRAEPWGNPADRRFVVRVAGLQSVVEEGLAASFDSFVAIERIESVGPRVGEQLRNDGIKAVLIALLLILLYIAIRFDVRYAPGAVAALFHDVLLTLAIFVIFQIEISLPIVAALLTIVGYSLNDTIVNFDRIRENIEAGALEKASLVEVVNRSVNECLSRTVLTSLTTLVAVGSILIFGGGMIQSFALAMTIGVVVGTYSSIFIASPIMIWTSNELDKRQRPVEMPRKRQPSV